MKDIRRNDETMKTATLDDKRNSVTNYLSKKETGIKTSIWF